MFGFLATQTWCFFSFPCFLVSPKMVRIYKRGLTGQWVSHIHVPKNQILLRVTLSKVYVSGFHLGPLRLGRISWNTFWKSNPRSFQYALIFKLAFWRILRFNMQLRWMPGNKDTKGREGDMARCLQICTENWRNHLILPTSLLLRQLRSNQRS